MDISRARRLHKSLDGRHVSGWQIGELIGHGGSAAVFVGARGDEEAAIKIIDPDLVAEFGEERQRQRVEAEGALIDHGQPNLVAVHKTGKCSDTGLLFIVMERLRYRTLSARLGEIPVEAISPVIAQIAAAAHWLDDRKICHRDIKPDNIMVADDWSRAVLMDLGIIMPFGEEQSPGQDPSGERFIGTARYCPPEFVRNRLQKDAQGYRAVTFYQLGAVLHDMIMARRMFDTVSGPYALLLDAIDRTIPSISSDETPQHLIFLARDCLAKSAQQRLTMVSWERFSGSATGASQSAHERVEAAFQSVSPMSGLAAPRARPMTRDAKEDLGRHIRSELSGTCEKDPRLLRPSVDFDALNDGVEVMAEFEAAPALGILRAFRIRFEARAIDAAAGTFTLDAEPAWLDEPIDRQELERYRVGVIRKPDDDLTDALKDFLIRTMAAAMGQPHDVDAKLKLDI